MARKNGNGEVQTSSFVSDLALNMRVRMDEIEQEARELTERLAALNDEHQKLTNAVTELHKEAK